MTAWFTKIRQHILSEAKSQATAGRRLMSAKKFIILLSVFVGLIVGVGAEVLRFLIGTLTGRLWALMSVLDAGWLLVLLPVAGVVLCGIYCRYVVKDNMEFGCQRIRQALDGHRYRLRPHLIYAPIVSCAVTLGFGGSAGSEGPIAYAGAGIGSNVGKFFGLSPDTLRILVGCGAGAGIAGIFKAPVGGALFAIEVLGMELTTVSVLALVSCCLASWFTSYLCSGMTLDLPMHVTHGFDAAMIPGVLLLGLFCGLYSLYYSYVMGKTEGFIGKFRNPWVKNVVSGLLIGVSLFIFPALYGEGYGVAGDIINGHPEGALTRSFFAGDSGRWVMLLFIGGVLLVKSASCALTNAGGGVGGDFAPTLFAGCMAGMFFSSCGNLLFGTSLSVADFAFFGMAGVMAGAIRAPLMAMFLTVEMSGNFGMFLPILLVSLVSFSTSRLLGHRVGVNLPPTWVHRDIDRLIARF
ncbi:MAG: chloride channel protein [Muribaculaceae bacterium]|nr:chloride channel protein [Muribaculaceae bacterium]